MIVKLRKYVEKEQLLSFLPVSSEQNLPLELVVGTYYGERVYKQVAPDTLVEPIFHEYYAHSSPAEWYKRAYHKFYC
ncbi:jg5390 [Pararge aegeria aegeria]|uniref:NADH dehydrogenase [ubiquinone] 1 alpha subcomplex subunit 13 n=1 Tax=Pararge aegeria aegeria TaxID=348720 RepID=A0A8S4SCL5_9NEOP|nr:jg5390 [Pararge aegeria aegeria]